MVRACFLSAAMTVLLYPRAIRTFIKNVLGGKNSDDDFEPRTDLNQPVGGLPV
jgi:hypothetical protein